MQTRKPSLLYVQTSNPLIPITSHEQFANNSAPAKVSSTTASGNLPNFSAYASSKASIQKAMETIHLESPQHGNFIIHPGFINTGGLGRKDSADNDEMRGFVDELLKWAVDEVELGADTMVALVGLSLRVLDGKGSGVERLNGRFFNATWDCELSVSSQGGSLKGVRGEWDLSISCAD